MKKIGIIYGSSTGTCQGIAETIAKKLGISSEEIIDVNKLTIHQTDSFEILFLGTSTWGDGELQDDWYDGIKILKETNLKNRIIALFGCGDSYGYPDTFCDAIAELHDKLESSGCIFIGQTLADGYSYSSSKAVINGYFTGLAIDEINESEKTDSRIDTWLNQIKKFIE